GTSRTRVRQIREPVAVEIGRDQVVAIAVVIPPVSRIGLKGAIAAAQYHLAVPSLAFQRFEDVKRAVAIEVGEDYVIGCVLPILRRVNWPRGEGAVAFAIERPDLAHAISHDEVQFLVAIDVRHVHQPRVTCRGGLGDGPFQRKLAATLVEVEHEIAIAISGSHNVVLLVAVDVANRDANFAWVVESVVIVGGGSERAIAVVQQHDHSIALGDRDVGLAVATQITYRHAIGVGVARMIRINGGVENWSLEGPIAIAKIDRDAREVRGAVGSERSQVQLAVAVEIGYVEAIAAWIPIGVGSGIGIAVGERSVAIAHENDDFVVIPRGIGTPHG